MNVALLLIDVQKAFQDSKWGNRNNLNAEENMLQLLKAWRQSNMPIIHIQHASTDEHSPLHPSKPGYELKDGFEPHRGESHFTKNVNSAFIGTDLEKRLKKLGCTDIVVIGLTTQHCVSTTTRMGANLGFHMHVVSDATAAFELTSFDGKQYSAEEVHHAALTNLHNEFATILTTEKAIETFIANKLLK
ncbi:cysteine hydrolase [Lottiidibacillus patelloidae]|uniref:Cysteine hydrolase n=1 Tax=Lottiidibacillus patelloidae TaxID=2670334 RepID=A0A263BRF8_9BACI|nr:cysteine hydrolase family protein [Lottiidibacillus patelloidae]OZM56162.1 cysteine hydrolase [Lottiidibacillus patelloidae]